MNSRYMNLTNADVFAVQNNSMDAYKPAKEDSPTRATVLLGTAAALAFGYIFWVALLSMKVGV